MAESKPKETKFFTRAQVAEHNDIRSTWFIIHNRVYDVTSFLNEHPGGEEVLLDQAGKNATEPFEDVGHSTDARAMMEPYKIGEIVEDEKTNDERNSIVTPIADDYSRDTWKSWVIPVAVGLLVTIVYRYFTSSH